MSNKLFIICPFSGIEYFLQKKYGNDIFFLTFSGAYLHYQEFDYILEVKQFIFRENIKTIYIVNDTSSIFINGIIKRNKIAGFPVQKVIEELYIDHYFSDFKGQSLFNQQNRLAELHIKKQINEMMNSTILGSCISEFDIEIKGLITSKENKKYKEIQNDWNLQLHPE